MKLQLVCLIFVLLTATTGNLNAFKIQAEPERDLASLEKHRAETVAESPSSALQMLRRRRKRFDSGSPSQFSPPGFNPQFPPPNFIPPDFPSPISPPRFPPPHNPLKIPQPIRPPAPPPIFPPSRPNFERCTTCCKNGACGICCQF